MKSLLRSQRCRRRRLSAQRHLHFETLEDRRLLAVLTVDDSGGADHTTIQAAVTAAMAYDTIQVADGTYNENVIVDKALTLDGAAAATTIIDASGGNYGLLLESGELTIKDFTIRDANLDGIRAYKAGGLNFDDVTLENLVVTENGAKGFEIHNNTVASDIEITNCQFVDNNSQGLRTASNVVLDGMVITDSNFDGNSYGMYLQGTIENVQISGSTFNNSTVNHGAYMTETGPLTNLVIENSEFNNNPGAGMMVWNVQDNSGITITGTEFQNNDKWGVLIWGDSLTDVLIEDSIIAYNDQLDLGYYGVDFFTYSDSMTNVVVVDSSIYGQLDGKGLKNRHGTSDPQGVSIVTAVNNWWGDGSGPQHSTNPTGLGDAVTDNVIFDPWKMALIQVQNGNLVIIGTPLKDHIQVKSKNDGLEVKIRSKDFKQDEFIDAATTATLDQIFIEGRDGDDHIKVHKNVDTESAFLLGGYGNDHLHGGGGYNLLHGGFGNDHLHGGGLDDVLIGGYGQDKLHGKKGNDLMIGGTLDDNSPAALEEVLADWTDNNILDFGLFVIDDEEKDDLNGDQGADLYYDGVGDKLKVKSKDGDSVYIA